jgi:hypothetical protein
MLAYKMTPFEVPSGKGKDAALELNRQLQYVSDEMAAAGWRLVSTEGEVYMGRTTWIRLFWERQDSP